MAGRGLDPVADAAHLEEYLGGRPVEDLAPERSDHVCTFGTGAPEVERDVGQGDRRRVGGVRGVGRRGQVQQDLHHPLHLGLVGRSESGDGVLDLVRGVLGDRQAPLGRLRHHDPGGLADAHGGADVHLEQDPFDRDRRHRELVQQTDEVIPELGQPQRELAIRVGTQHAQRDGTTVVPAPSIVDLEHAVTAPGQAGIDAEDEHRFDRSDDASRRGGPGPRPIRQARSDKLGQPRSVRPAQSAAGVSAASSSSAGRNSSAGPRYRWM